MAFDPKTFNPNDPETRRKMDALALPGARLKAMAAIGLGALTNPDKVKAAAEQYPRELPLPTAEGVINAIGLALCDAVEELAEGDLSVDPKLVLVGISTYLMSWKISMAARKAAKAQDN